ncbi:DEKNAAC104116 [Brettanomyces naardenensis]|uniref:Sphingolipid delta(4)-desaturase n=1 Tax=Brettanomyces naardenensis TaxID=13370 RepID=A0A448YPU3_BRENA|nr:DEKNAAC104116 [Brettanomyces naardenensis]
MSKIEAPGADIISNGHPTDFYWTQVKDPHTIRRKLIIKKYPKITKLCGPEPLTKYIATGVVLTQFTAAYLLRNTYPLSPLFLIIAYVLGGTCNQNIFMCIHELSHNLGFKKPLPNKLFSIFVNLPIAVPFSASFQPYHQLHHKFLGDENYDTDLPTRFEAHFLKNVPGKLFFATFQIFFYALRPVCIASIPITYIHLLNVVAQFAFDYWVVTNWGWYSLFYFLLSSFFAGSLHPTAGHFVAEHYIFSPPKHYRKFIDAPPAETYSYYGPLNTLVWNVGYHNEHHDFPYIPWSRLPELRKQAAEFYDGLPNHESWVWTIFDFIFSYDITMYNRIKRKTAGMRLREQVDFEDNSK